jgi:thiamine pyrophosphate-dependent acetolactate synthase large subunit-like protein
MVTTASDVLVDRLIDWGVDTIFGIPGNGINGIMEALWCGQADRKVRGHCLPSASIAI